MATKGSKKPGAGAQSRLTRQQILEAAREYFEKGALQGRLAADLGISSSYLARRLSEGQRQPNHWFRVKVITDDTIIDTEAVLAAAKGRTAVTVTGTKCCVVFDAAQVSPFSQTIELNGVTVTIAVKS